MNASSMLDVEELTDIRSNPRRETRLVTSLTASAMGIVGDERDVHLEAAMRLEAHDPLRSLQRFDGTSPGRLPAPGGLT